jgi:Tfp pilus assembly protein PilN
MRFIVIVMAIAGLSAPALAQTQLLPRTSPAEQQVRDINQALQRQNRSLNSQQRDDFEVNQLRQELQRQRTVPPIVAPGPAGRICVGC